MFITELSYIVISTWSLEVQNKESMQDELGRGIWSK